MHQSMDEIYSEFYPKVYGVALRMTQNVALAEDLAQETFIHINNGLDSFRANSKLSTWIHRVTINTVLMHMRKKSTKVERFSIDEGVIIGDHNQRGAFLGDDDIFTMAENLAADPVFFDEHIDLERAFNSLPPGYRQSLELHDIVGMNHEEVAVVMGCVEGTVKSQVHKARQRMRKLLGGEVPFKKV